MRRFAAEVCVVDEEEMKAGLVAGWEQREEEEHEEHGELPRCARTPFWPRSERKD